MADEKKLGRGLSALLGESGGTGAAAGLGGEAATPAQRALRLLPIEQLSPGKFQPRHRFQPAELKELADSVRANGILQPILVRKKPGGGGNAYEIVAGERRWRAAQQARLHEVPVLLRDFTDREALEIALVENLQRENLSPIEEAEGYRRLLEEFDNTQEDLADHLGKSRSHITNLLRLLTLPDAVKAMIDDGQLSAGHARTLVGQVDALALAKRIASEGLSVRAAERLAQDRKRQGKAELKGPGKKRRLVDADTLQIERDLSSRLGLKVEIHHKGRGGSVTIQYKDLDQLDGLIAKLSKG